MLRARSVVALALGVLLACVSVAHAATFTLDGVRDSAYGQPFTTVLANTNPGPSGQGPFWGPIMGELGSSSLPVRTAVKGYSVYMSYSDDDHIYVLIEFSDVNERFHHNYLTGLWVDLAAGNEFTPDVYFGTYPLAEGYEGLQTDIFGIVLSEGEPLPFTGGDFIGAYYKDNVCEMAFAGEGLAYLQRSLPENILPLNDNSRITISMVQAPAASLGEAPSATCGPYPFTAAGVAELEFNTVPTCALPEFDGGEPNDGDIGFPTSTKSGFPTSTKTGFDGFPTSTKTGAGTTMKRSRTRVAKVAVNEEACPDGGEEGAMCQVVMTCPYGFGFDHTAQSTKTVTMYCVPSEDETDELSYQFMDATEDQLRTCDFLGVPRKHNPKTKFATKGTLPAP